MYNINFAYLTRQGLLTCVNENWAFYSNVLEFRRPTTEKEAKSLIIQYDLEMVEFFNKPVKVSYWDENSEFQLVDNGWDDVPTDSNGDEDWSRSNDGGNCAFGSESILVDGKEICQLGTTSAGFPYCQLSCTFTDTVRIQLQEDENIWIEVSKQVIDKYQDTLSLIEIINLVR